MPACFASARPYARGGSAAFYEEAVAVAETAVPGRAQVMEAEERESVRIERLREFQVTPMVLVSCNSLTS